MAYKPYGLTSAAEIIRRAAIDNDEGLVADGRAPARLLRYYDVLNDFLQSMARGRSWWFLQRECSFATKSGLKTYNMRLQASSTITFAGIPLSTETLVVDGVTYTLTATAASVADAMDDVCELVNAGTKAYALVTSATTVEMYWSGNDGDAKVVSDTMTSVTTENFSLSMEDFSALTSRPLWHNFARLVKVDPNMMREGSILPNNGQPIGYALTQGEDVIRIYGSGYGAPDDIYPIDIAYQALPSAVLPNGVGQIDLPLQFRGILPRAIKLMLNMDSYDESAVLGDQIVQRWLGDLEAFQADRTLDETDTSPDAGDIYMRLDTRVVDT